MEIKDALQSWHKLNAALRDCDEEFAKLLFRYERKHLNREGFILRIHSRLNRLRRAREREALS